MTPAADTLAPDDPHAQVRATVRNAGSSFFWGMRLLPPERRAAIYAVYAYCREIDDIADGEQPGEAKLAALDAWRTEIDRLDAGAPTSAIGRALAAARTRFALPGEEFRYLLDGMERDARGGEIAPTHADLRLYCRQVAGAVGMLAMPIFAADDPRADGETSAAIAVTLGEALQLTNILRDLGDDAARGRLYLPRELLEANGVTARTPDALLADPKLPAACRDLAATADARFQRARALLDTVSPATARPCRLMLEMYARLLRRLRENDWRHPERRLSIPKRDKLAVVLRHGLR